MTHENDPASAVRPSDTLFKRIVIVATALSLAITYGWLACFDRQPSGDFYFHWQWSALLWIAIGLVSNAYFWRKIWPPAGRAAVTRRGAILGSLALALPCLWWLTFPLRFLSGQHFWDVMSGLIAAAAVLSFGAWMVIKLIKAFEQSDNDVAQPKKDDHEP
ncbi:MAG TPA: hypothetical protein VGO57_03385 [Verrucomicrobiae bacterium]|jgi:hypothetical protein